MENIQPTSLQHIKPTMPNTILPAQLSGRPVQGATFSDLLDNSISEINKLQQNANDQVEKLASGEVKDVHQVMIAAQEANLTFSMMMQVRNKL